MTQTTLNIPNTPARKLALFAGDIKIAHTIFALPFALLSTFMAAKLNFGGLPPIAMLLLILICMITARTVAMSANRLLDADLDAANPRTRRRAIPSGQLTRTFYIATLALCAAAFIATTFFFWFLYRNPWPIALAIPVLAFI